ncbi:hypothetical protein J19TS2_46270 [Cohnella xylanilytica]|uniref:Uncharacterized protein n=1 Tax=Cohnella xylanilytica TaxID=557555 RepID=A0A841TUL8_9BACL|nr:hypothetical protein [Cohnella xylanilytica]MBB6690622.1 hypothetical protein [Cohnella xylanilytica]GIO15072.1 hypothetical protein J19TS2_46270 [Cohnella xylanilytica]
MANNKWIKWIVGLSGAALFSGLVGFLSNEGAATATATAGPSAVQSPDSGQDSLKDQWNADDGAQDAVPDDGSGDTGSGFGRRGAGDGFSGSYGGDAGQDGSSFGGRMRTRAS